MQLYVGDKIHAMTSPIGNRFLETNSYILTHEMAKFIAGHNKMTVFAYLNVSSLFISTYCYISDFIIILIGTYG